MGEGHVREWTAEDCADGRLCITEGRKEGVQEFVAWEKGTDQGYTEHQLGLTDIEIGGMMRWVRWIQGRRRGRGCELVLCVCLSTLVVGVDGLREVSGPRAPGSAFSFLGGGLSYLCARADGLQDCWGSGCYRKPWVSPAAIRLAFQKEPWLRCGGESKGGQVRRLQTERGQLRRG